MEPTAKVATLLAVSLASTLAVCGCSGRCAGGDETVSPDSLGIFGDVTYSSETTGDVKIDLAAVTEPHYAEPIYDGERLDLAWQVDYRMAFQLTLLGPLETGTNALTDLGARVCACEDGFLQGPAEKRECLRNGGVTPAWCEDVVGEALIRQLSRECIGSSQEECAERVDMDIVIPQADGARFSGTVLIRWFESVQSRSCVDGPIDMS